MEIGDSAVFEALERDDLPPRVVMKTLEKALARLSKPRDVAGQRDHRPGSRLRSPGSEDVMAM